MGESRCPESEESEAVPGEGGRKGDGKTAAHLLLYYQDNSVHVMMSSCLE